MGAINEMHKEEDSRVIASLQRAARESQMEDKTQWELVHDGTLYAFDGTRVERLKIEKGWLYRCRDFEPGVANPMFTSVTFVPE